MVAHERVDLRVLALLDLVYLGLAAYLELVALLRELLLVLLLDLLGLLLELLAQAGHVRVVGLLQVAYDVLVRQLLLLDGDLQVALLLAQLVLVLVVELLVDLVLQLRLGLELRQIVLMLVEQVLHLLLHHLDLDLVALLAVLHLAVLVAQLGLLLLKLTLGDLPERVHLVALQLKVVALLALAVQLLAYVHDVLLELLFGHLLGRDALDDGGRAALARLLALSFALLRRLQRKQHIIIFKS